MPRRRTVKTVIRSGWFVVLSGREVVASMRIADVCRIAHGHGEKGSTIYSTCGFQLSLHDLTPTEAFAICTNPKARTPRGAVT